MSVLLKLLKSIIDTDLGRSRVLDFQHIQKALNLTFDSGAMPFDGRVSTEDLSDGHVGEIHDV